MTKREGVQSSLPLAIAVILGFANVHVRAQQVPDAGQILRESAPPKTLDKPRPAPALPSPPESDPSTSASSVSFVLNELTFAGNTVFSDDALASLAADKIGQKVNLADLEEIAQRVTRKYRAAGYFLAQAVVAPQDVSSGSVEISVIEGQLGRVRIESPEEPPITEERVRKTLSRVTPGKPLFQPDFERQMLILSDLPGVTVQSSLEQGDEPGSADLIIEVAPSRRWDFSLTADNYGSRASGEYRIGALGRIKSPLGLGDNLDLRLLNSSRDGVSYGRVAYEMPLGYAGTRWGGAYSRVEYDLGKDFEALDATGEADVFELTLTHPFIRSRARNLFGRVGYENKRLEDEIGIVSQTSDKRISNVLFGLAHEARDGFFGGGYTSAGLTLYFGDLDIRSDDALAVDQSAFGRRTDGRYERAAYQITRLQSVTDRSSVYLGLAGQFATENLDSAEKIAIGGPNAVRAYPVSEGIADEGYVLNAEYRYSIKPNISVSGFYDIGRARFNEDPFPDEPDNKRTLRGYGLGLFWDVGAGFFLRASLAWRDTGKALSESGDRHPRLFTQITKSF